MSDAITNVAAALTSAQARKSSRPGKPAARTANAPTSESARRFAKAANARPLITFETAARLVPSDAQIAAIITGFGLDDVNYPEIRDASEAAFAAMAKALEPALVVDLGNGETNNKALEMHLQRIAGAFVGSAHGAATFYENKRQQARELGSQFNEAREEDRMGIDGMANRAQRAREFAAALGLKAYATLAAAEGALSAYEHIIGSTWKPYEGRQDNGAGVSPRCRRRPVRRPRLLSQPRGAGAPVPQPFAAARFTVLPAGFPCARPSPSPRPPSQPQAHRRWLRHPLASQQSSAAPWG